MKKVATMSLIVLSMVLFSQSFAQKKENENTSQTMKGAMTHKQMMHHGEQNEMMEGCSMHAGMMKEMMMGTIISTSDGGIVVRMGNTLTKYDKDLNLIKEVELKIDFDAMQKMMKEMKEKCPMCKGMMEEKGKDGAHMEMEKQEKK